MRNIVIAIFLMSLTLSFWGCSQETTNIDVTNDQGKSVMGLDYRDFADAAAAMVKSLLQSGRLQKKDGSRYVVTTGRIKNDTMQRIDTDQLMAKIEEEIMNSGMVVMTSAVGGKGASDEMIYQVRDLAEGDKQDEFNKDTMPAKGQIILPELSISGKILQRDVKYDKKTTQVEYYFQLKLTDIKTGLRFWQKEKFIGKRGSRKSTSW